MDLSSLFGPPVVLLSKAQLDRVVELANEEGVTGVVIADYGPGVASFVAQRAKFEGARGIPSESSIDNEEQTLVDFYGNTYPGTSEAWNASLDQAEASVASLREEVMAALEREDAQRVLEG